MSDRPKPKIGRIIAVAAAAVALGISAYAGCGGCRSSNADISQIPPEQLEKIVMRLAPDQKARVVYYIASNDELTADGAYSAGTYFMESYKRQKE